MLSDNSSIYEGGVVANDADKIRAYMLTHQLNRANSHMMCVLNHNAQFFPSLKNNNEKLLFDKVMCDVPCSGDGAIRKLPDIWDKWNTTMGININSLQLSIL